MQGRFVNFHSASQNLPHTFSCPVSTNYRWTLDFPIELAICNESCYLQRNNPLASKSLHRDKDRNYLNVSLNR